ncbi:hypothetical protein EHQ58_18435 [Leptospira ognonensis]|uniref:Uncharacterized protein n=1 Tax=Leptospira ognonensis TaxID=2484945 RepID=A0A4R9JTX8_9LEPT|nr:hypothetical protein [Leptospira ognonensis]TGL55700.1 hypothetical protein EHQ58_18435 [Leptospira ognonensis]
MLLTLNYPKNFERIIKIVREKDYLIHPYKTNISNIYNPSNYFENIRFLKITYKLILDRNIFSYIISSIKSKEPNINLRNAIALISFCQFSEILIEPSLAIYEKINYDKNHITDALEELRIFRSIDNSPNPESLIAYACGFKNNFQTQKMERQDISIEDWFSKYDKLTN